MNKKQIERLYRRENTYQYVVGNDSGGYFITCYAVGCNEGAKFPERYETYAEAYHIASQLMVLARTSSAMRENRKDIRELIGY